MLDQRHYPAKVLAILALFGLVGNSFVIAAETPCECSPTSALSLKARANSETGSNTAQPSGAGECCSASAIKSLAEAGQCCCGSTPPKVHDDDQGDSVVPICGCGADCHCGEISLPEPRQPNQPAAPSSPETEQFSPASLIGQPFLVADPIPLTAARLRSIHRIFYRTSAQTCALLSRFTC